MDRPHEFDPTSAHKHFSQKCFNQAWDLMEKSGRTQEEDLQMLYLSLASIWHWTQRDDCAPKNLAVGYWQASRIYSMLGEADNARRFGQLSLDYSREEAPFLKAYAFEALARAELLAGNHSSKSRYLKQARELTNSVTDVNEKSMILTDLDTIR